MQSSVALSIAEVEHKRVLYYWSVFAHRRLHWNQQSMGKRTARALLERRLTYAENLVAAQMQEMELVRQKVYELERNQMQIKARYVFNNFPPRLSQVAHARCQI